MKKYMVFRAPKEVDRDMGKHELVGVETGEDIYAVTDALIRVVTDDLSQSPEYAKCEAFAYAPKEMESYRRTKRYQHYMTGVVEPPNAEENILVEYGITEQDAD